MDERYSNSQGLIGTPSLTNQCNPAPGDTLRKMPIPAPEPRAVEAIIAEIEDTEREIAKLRPIADMHHEANGRLFPLRDELSRALRKRALAAK